MTLEPGEIVATRSGVEVIAEPSAYTVYLRGTDSYEHMTYAISVERNPGIVRGVEAVRWAVRWMGRCLAVDGKHWDWEPLPSSRSDEWLEEYRFDTFDAALAAAQEAAPKIVVNGRSAIEARRLKTVRAWLPVVEEPSG
jgi:hypothetical protein